MRPRQGGLNTRAMLEAARDGRLGVLSILGANPMLRFRIARWSKRRCARRRSSSSPSCS